MSAKLTKPQAEFLRECGFRERRVVRGYKPAEKLSALGFIAITVTEGSYAWVCAITGTGRLKLIEMKS